MIRRIREDWAESVSTHPKGCKARKARTLRARNVRSRDSRIVVTEPRCYTLLRREKIGVARGMVRRGSKKASKAKQLPRDGVRRARTERCDGSRPTPRPDEQSPFDARQAGAATTRTIGRRVEKTRKG